MEIKLEWARNRAKEAALCPCGQDNKKNPAFAPFKDTDGKYGFCHRCGQTFMPNNTAEQQFVYTPPPRAAQKFCPEPDFSHSKLIDTLVGEAQEGDIRTMTFYYRDVRGRLTSAKAMDYRFPEVKRVKDRHPLHLFQRDSGYYACLFNEHALTREPDATVILVESEKTAAVITARLGDQHEFIFLATGGSNGLTDDKMPPLRGRNVWILFDCDNGEEVNGEIIKPKGREAAQAAYLKLAGICASVKVLDIDPELHDGTDLADLPKETTTLEYLRSLGQLDRVKTPISQALIDTLRQMNRDGQLLTDEKITELGQSFGINPDRLRAVNDSILRQWSKETNISRASLNERVMHWLEARYEFRRNTLTSLVQMRLHGGHWMKINSATIWNEINIHSREIGKSKKGDLQIARTMIDNLIESDFVPNFNPLVDYFENLPAWDGEDHITKLANHVQVDPETQEFWVSQFKKAIVRSIACSIGGEVNRVVMVLVSESQSLGKSTFLRYLCPAALRDLYKEEPMVHTKDTEIALCENFIWNLEELDSLNRGEISAMKAIISRASVKQRRSYARYEEYMPRIVNFWGSTNKNDFLTDSENTRWLCFNVLSINHDYHNTLSGVRNVDIDKVWAQAWHLYHQKSDFILSKADSAIQGEMNRNFEILTEEKQLILRHFTQIEPDKPGAVYMTNLEIRESLDEITGRKTHLVEQNIGRAMKQLGYKSCMRKVNGKTTRGYFVIFSKQPSNYDDQPAAAGQSLPLPWDDANGTPF